MRCVRYCVVVGVVGVVVFFELVVVALAEADPPLVVLSAVFFALLFFDVLFFDVVFFVLLFFVAVFEEVGGCVVTTRVVVTSVSRVDVTTTVFVTGSGVFPPLARLVAEAARSTPITRAASATIPPTTQTPVVREEGSSSVSSSHSTSCSLASPGESAGSSAVGGSSP